MAKQYTELQKMALWVRASWQNHLKYMVYNNPQEVLNIIADDYDIATDRDYTEADIEALTFDIANNCQNPEEFTKTLSNILPHNSKQEGWANIYNYQN